MSPEAIGEAAAMILAQRVPVTLYVRYGLRGEVVASKMIPCGSTQAICAGRFTRAITLEELADDVNIAHRELVRLQGRKAA